MPFSLRALLKEQREEWERIGAIYTGTNKREELFKIE